MCCKVLAVCGELSRRHYALATPLLRSSLQLSLPTREDERRDVVPKRRVELLRLSTVGFEATVSAIPPLRHEYWWSDRGSNPELPA